MRSGTRSQCIHMSCIRYKRDYYADSNVFITKSSPSNSNNSLSLGFGVQSHYLGLGLESSDLIPSPIIGLLHNNVH